MNPSCPAVLCCAFVSLLPVLPCSASGRDPDRERSRDLKLEDWGAIRTAMYTAAPCPDGSISMRNPEQQWRAEFDGRGFTIYPDRAVWTWGLELVQSDSAAVRHEGERLFYDRSETMTEWYCNDTRGLEQGWTMHRRPGRKNGNPSADDERVRLTLMIRGGLDASVSADGTSVAFCNSTGEPLLHYGGLTSWDADGKVLPSRFEQSSSDSLDISVDDRGARYPVTIDPVAQQAYLKPFNPDSGDRFGSAVAVSGDTVVVGAPSEASYSGGVNGNGFNDSAPWAGAAYVFVRSGGTWTQEAYLKASNTGRDDFFGVTVGISGDTIVVGSPYESSRSAGVDGWQWDESAPGAGAVYVFARSGGTWSQQAYLKASNPGGGDGWVRGDNFGYSVSVSGETIVVGAPFESSSATGVNGNQFDEAAPESGAAYVFARYGTSWIQEAYLKASNAEGEEWIIREGDEFGTSVAVSGGTILVGAPGEDSRAAGVDGDQSSNEASESGAAYVFRHNGTTWGQQAYLKASNPGFGNLFGACVALSGNLAVIGSPEESSAARGVNGQPGTGAGLSWESGAAYIFERTASIWTQQAYLKASNPDEDDYFGISVAAADDSVLVGAYFEDSAAAGMNGDQNNNDGFHSGAAYLFSRNGSTWNQHAYIKASRPVFNAEFGLALALDGNTAVIGAAGDSSSASVVNGNQNDLSMPDAGAAYVFNVTPPPPAPEITVARVPDIPVADGATLDFGTVVPGTGIDWIFTAANDGGATLSGLSISINGPSAADFTVVTPPAGTVGAGGGTHFIIRFRPSVSGPKEATLHLASNDPDENPYDIRLTAIASRPAGITVLHNGSTLTSSGTPIEFGTVTAGTSSEAKVFTVRNDGDEELSFIYHAIEGSGADFPITSTLGSSLAPGGSAQVAVAFKPTGHGLKEGTLRIVSYSENEVSFSVPLRGTGFKAADIVLWAFGLEATDGAGEHDIGSTLAGGSGVTRMLDVGNRGGESLTGFSATITGEHAADFSVNLSGLPGALAAESYGTVAVTFLPFVAGPRRAVLHIASNDPDESPFDISLTGTGLTISDVAGLAHLKAHNADEQDEFGGAVAISGDTVVVGAAYEDSGASLVNGNGFDEFIPRSGAAYVFVRNGTSWTQQAYLKAPASERDAFFGISVAISGNTIAVGAPNSSYARANLNDYGRVFVYVRNGTSWTFQASLKAPQFHSEAMFGASVSLDGDNLAVGSPWETSNATGVNGDQSNSTLYRAGAAYVYRRTGTQWSTPVYFKASNTAEGDEFGAAVAISGDTLIVGAPYEDGSTTGVNGDQADNARVDSGAAYVFARSGDFWSQQAYCKAASPGERDWFGRAVDVAGDVAVVGAMLEDSAVGNQADESATDAGAAYVFARNGTAWAAQTMLKAANAGSLDHFGSGVAIDGDTILVGARYEGGRFSGIKGDPTDNSVQASGAAYLFRRSGIVWSQIEYAKPSNTGYCRGFGSSVGLSGNLFVAGAPGEFTSALGPMGYYIGGYGSGAAYVFSIPARAEPLINLWRMSYFGQALSSGTAADDADPDRDGLSNLMEFASGQPPLIAQRPGTGGALPAATAVQQGAARTLRMEYLRRRPETNPGVTYTIQFADDLTGVAPGPWIDATGTETVNPIDGEWERVTVDDNATPMNGRRFGRLRVTRP